MTYKQTCIFLASTLLLGVAPPAGAAPEPQSIDVGATMEGLVSIDAANVLVRGGQRAGWKQIQATVQLDKPVFYAAREITQEVQTQDWDCPRARYRVILRVFRTNDGAFVRSDRDVTPWMNVPKDGPQRTTFELLCPKAADEVVDGG